MACGINTNCVKPGKPEFGLDLGVRPYHDEYGSTYIRIQPDYSWENSDRLYYNVTENPDEVILYLPSNPPVDQNVYNSWPLAVKAIIPWDWSGDYTRGGWASGFAGKENDYNPPESVLLTPYLYDQLRGCGWGRWAGVKSRLTGENGRCEYKTRIGDVGQFIGIIFKSLARIVSFIPGVGQIMGPILGGIGAIAAGENISAVMIEAASNALPGGGVAASAAKSGARFAQSLAEGKDAGTALLDSGREYLKSSGAPIEILDAYDFGVAIGTAKGLQDAGFKILGKFIESTDVYDQGTKFLDSVREANVIGTSTEKYLTIALSRDVFRAVGPVAAQKLDPILEKVAIDPALRNMPSRELATAFNVLEPIARAAQVIGQYGYVNQQLRTEILKTISQRIWEKYGMAAFEKGPLNMKFTEALLKQQDEVLKLGMTIEGNRFTDYYYQEYPQMSMTAGRIATGGLGSPLNPGNDAGIRVDLDKMGVAFIADTNKAPASFAYRKAKLANDIQRRFFNIGIGALVQNKWTPEQMYYWMSALGPDQLAGWNAAYKIWTDNSTVHPAVRVELAKAGAAIAAADPVYQAARNSVPEDGKRGFDIALGQLMGNTGFSVELESVRNTIEHDPALRKGFDTAVAVVRGRQNSEVPAGLTAGQTAGFLATQGLKGNPSTTVKAGVLSNVASNAETRDGAVKALGFWDKVLDFFGLL